jgi:hypothetical protein
MIDIATPKNLWSEFNGRNHVELAIRHQLPIKTVYARLAQACQEQKRTHGIKHLEALLDDRAANASLTMPVLVGLARQALALKAYRISLRLLWRCSGARQFSVARSYRRHARRLVRPLKTLARTDALRGSIFRRIRSFISLNQ